MHCKQSNFNVRQDNRVANAEPGFHQNDKCVTFLELGIESISSTIHLPPDDAPLTELEDG